MKKSRNNASKKAEQIIERAVACYAARLHLNKATSIVNPSRKINIGYAPTFPTVTPFLGRMEKTAKLPDLYGVTEGRSEWMAGLPRSIFLSDMGDAYTRKSDFPFLEREVIEYILSKNGRRHLWLWLTKRPENMRAFANRLGGFPENVCGMTTLTEPDRKNLRRLESLKQVDAHMKGLSIEPLRKRIAPEELPLDGIDWVIIGGELGKHAYPFHLEWARELIDHCRASNTAVFMKQLGRHPMLNGEEIRLKDNHGGDWSEWPQDLRIREFPEAFHRYRQDSTCPAQCGKAA